MEMDKLENLEKKPIEEWRISEKIDYVIRFSQAEKKQKIIQKLIEKEEIVAMMEEKKRDYLRDTSLAIPECGQSLTNWMNKESTRKEL